MNAQRTVRSVIVLGSLTLAVLLSVGCGGSGVGEIRATGVVTPKALERVQVTAAPKKETTEVVTTKAPTQPPAPTATPKATETPVPPRCVPATDAQMEAIQMGIEGIDAGNDVRKGWAVRSNDFKRVWMVAAMIYGAGMENGTGPGVWAMGGEMEEPGMVLSVNAFAEGFSDWGLASKTDAAITLASDGVSEAIRCALQNR